jgi:diadenosine tetraphosphatase ApaH/serine/threonine PP2A family protein phosphatase
MELFELIPGLCFCGHTHVPCVIRDDLRCFYAGEVRLERGRKYIINPGSVGQPRDGDPRSSFAVFYGDRVAFRRLAYDVDLTCRKILNSRGLHRFMADRLRVGR